MSRSFPPIRIRRRAPAQAPACQPEARPRATRKSNAAIELPVKSQLSADMPITNEELDALERLLGEDLARFLEARH